MTVKTAFWWALLVGGLCLMVLGSARGDGPRYTRWHESGTTSDLTTFTVRTDDPASSGFAVYLGGFYQQTVYAGYGGAYYFGFYAGPCDPGVACLHLTVKDGLTATHVVYDEEFTGGGCLGCPGPLGEDGLPHPAGSDGGSAVINTGTINVGGPSCAWTYDVELTRACAGDTTNHTVEVIVGATHYGPTDWAAGNFSGSFDGNIDSGNNVVLKIDGVVQDTHSINCYGDPPPGNGFSANATIGATCSATPTPSPGGGGGTPTPPPGSPPPGSPPPGSPPPGSGGGSGPPNPSIPPEYGTPANVNLINPSVVFDAMKAALEEAQSDVPPPPDGGNTGGALGVAPVLDDPERGHMDEIQPQMEAMIADKNDLVENLKGKLDGFNFYIDSLPTGFGTVSSIPFDLSGLNSVGGGEVVTAFTYPTGLSLSQFAAGIAQLRAILVWLLRVTFFIKCLQIFAAQGGATKVVG